jgi:hypothetical protein
MMTFDSIAVDLLRAHGFRVLRCESDAEAIEKAASLKNGSLDYPVHFAASDTSGEKAYEEFYTDTECVDLERLQALGVITGKPIPDRARLNGLLTALENAFADPDVEKETIVSIISAYYPNFAHIETGRSLDSKM